MGCLCTSKGSNRCSSSYLEARLLLYFLKGDVLTELSQHQLPLPEFEDSKFGDHHRNHPLTRQWNSTARQQLHRNLAVLSQSGVLHQHDDPRPGGDQVHGSSHPLHHLPRDHPVGDVPLLTHLEGPQHGDVQVPASDHPERLGRRKVRSSWLQGDRLLAGVDVIRVHFSEDGVVAHSQNSILALDADLHARGQHLGKGRGDADSQVDAHAILHLPSRPSHYLETRLLVVQFDWVAVEHQLIVLDGTELDAPLDLNVVGHGQPLNYALGVFAEGVHLVDAVHVDGGHVDGFRIESPCLHDLLHLSHHALCCCRHVEVEVSSCLVKLQVSQGICPPGLDEGKISEDRLLLEILASPEVLDWLWQGELLRFNILAHLPVLDHVAPFLNHSSDPSRSVEGGNAGSSTPELF